MSHATCASCQHYANPGAWSARCKLSPPVWSREYERGEEWAIVRAGNSCERWASAVALEDRRAA